ncbi:unnamed protein product [Cochlearia groenlandica]
MEREQQYKKATVVSSEFESDPTPTPSEAIRISKGKGVAGTSKFRAVRNIFPAGTRKDETARHYLNLDADEEDPIPRRRVQGEPDGHGQNAPRHRGHAQRRTETIAGHRVYVDSDDDYYNHSDRSRRSRRHERRDRDDPRDPERQQLKHIKANAPLGAFTMNRPSRLGLSSPHT